MSHCRGLAIAIAILILISGCLSEQGVFDEGVNSTQEDNNVEIWHSFASGSTEERTFLTAIEQFEAANPHIIVEVTMVPFANADQLFMTAAQGGEAPDLIRLSSDQLGKIGEVRVDGYPLLEDLRNHLTPIEMASFESRALSAMRYDSALYGIPASQDCLSLIYNKALFTAAGVDYPDENWTTDDMLNAAKELTQGDVQGMALPVKVAYWWFGFQTGFGGQLFDENGIPTLNSNGSAQAMDWILDLEKVHGVVATGIQIESMKTQFQEGKAAMIIDGPWNWATYETSRIDLGQSLLPIVDSTGLRMSPLVTYKGWSLSKHSNSKVAATELALWLSSPSVQKQFALDTFTMPTSIELSNDVDISANPVISGFLNQAEVGTPAPTSKGMSLVYGPLSTAFEQVYSDLSDSQTSLSAANQELKELMGLG